MVGCKAESWREDLRRVNHRRDSERRSSRKFHFPAAGRHIDTWWLLDSIDESRLLSSMDFGLAMGYGPANVPRAVEQMESAAALTIGRMLSGRTLQLTARRRPPQHPVHGTGGSLDSKVWLLCLAIAGHWSRSPASRPGSQ